VKRFEEFWFEFERKSFNWKSFGKEKEKEKRKPYYLSAQAAQQPTSSFPQRPVSLFSFLLFPRTLTYGPHLSAPLPPSFSLLFPLLRPLTRRRDPRRAWQPPFLFFPRLSRPIKATILPQSNPHRFLPFPPSIAQLRQIARRPSMAKTPADYPPSASPPFSPCCYLSSSSGSRHSLCTRSAPVHALEHQSHQHRHLCISPPPDAVGEVLLCPYLFFLRRDHIPHVTLIVQGKSSPDCATPGALVPAHRSAARPAAVIELHHRRLPFARELTRLFFTW
jgi:hypothetical protein